MSLGGLSRGQFLGFNIGNRSCDLDPAPRAAPAGERTSTRIRQAPGDKDDATRLTSHDGPHGDQDGGEIATTPSDKQVDRQTAKLARILAEELQPQLEESVRRASARLEQRLQGILDAVHAQGQAQAQSHTPRSPSSAAGLANSLKWAQQGCAPPGAEPPTQLPKLESLNPKVSPTSPTQRERAKSSSQDVNATVRSVLDVVVIPQLERLVHSSEKIERLTEASGRPLAELERHLERLRGLEDRLLRKVEETRLAVLASLQPAVHALKSQALAATNSPDPTIMRSGTSTLPRSGTEPLMGAKSSVSLGLSGLTVKEPTELEASVALPPPNGRTLVVNFRRFRALLEMGNIYQLLLHATAVVGFVALLRSSGKSVLILLDLGFIVCGLLLFEAHGLEHGSLKPHALGELTGDDGQKILDESSPGQLNPNRSIAALTLHSRNERLLASGIKAVIWLLNLGLWVPIICNWFGVDTFGTWPEEELEHTTALNAIGSVQLVANLLFGLLIWRETEAVLPLLPDGTVQSLGDPGTFNRWLGPPCIWFGSPAAREDLCIWASLASYRSRRWSLHHSLPRILPQELAVYALQGRERAARVARDLRGAKLFDKHRRTYGKRSRGTADRKPAVVLKGLSDENRGCVYDVDLRREDPEALDLRLIMYDSRTEHSWEPVQNGRDPQEWAEFVQWNAVAPRTVVMSDDVPVWDSSTFMATSPDMDIFPGTFGGFRTAIWVVRNTLDTATDVQMEIASLKKLGEHPHITSILTSGLTPEGQNYIALESHEAVGCLLSQVANQYRWAQQELPPGLVTQLFMGLADALSFMHARSLLHRSLRAEGVVVTMDFQAKLADVGMPGRPGMRQRLKARHVAPELCKGATQDASVDLWGLGVVLHELYQGSADLVDTDHDPVRMMPGTPSVARPMELFLQEAMQGLLSYDVGYRWSMDMLLQSQWFNKIQPGAGPLPILTEEYEHRRHLRRFLGRSPPPRAVAARVEASDKGLLGKQLKEALPDGQAELLLVKKASGTFSFPRSSLRLGVGDWLFYGVPQTLDADAVLSRLGRDLVLRAEAEPPVLGFQRSRTDLGATLTPRAEEDMTDAMAKLVPFQPEFDCFFFPPHACGEEGMISVLREHCIHVTGILREGQWLPDWFPSETSVAHPGDLGLVLRAPQKESRSAHFSGLTVPSVDDSDLEPLMQPSEFASRLAIRRGLEE